LLDSPPVEARVPGALYVRDGLPLLKLGGGSAVHGHVLRFREGEAKEAYDTIGSFEPKKHYRWRRVIVDDGVVANALIGLSSERGSIHDEEGVWTGRQDPVFTPGLSAVREVADRDAREEFYSAPPDRFDWPRLFRLQMAYLLLWTIIERYASLAYGPTLRPEEKIERFGQDPAFKRALKGVVTRAGEVYNSQDPEIPPARLDPEHPVSSAYYYRRVRHNLTHRGKGAWKDGEINRKSLVELQGIVDHVLTERVGLQG
jgi:hypothetical protein